MRAVDWKPINARRALGQSVKSIPARMLSKANNNQSDAERLLKADLNRFETVINTLFKYQFKPGGKLGFFFFKFNSGTITLLPFKLNQFQLSGFIGDKSIFAFSRYCIVVHRNTFVNRFSVLRVAYIFI